jgi:hypothetical protein
MQFTVVRYRASGRVAICDGDGISAESRKADAGATGGNVEASKEGEMEAAIRRILADPHGIYNRTPQSPGERMDPNWQ